MVKTFEIFFISSRDKILKISYFETIEEVNSFIQEKNIDSYLIVEVLFIEIEDLREIFKAINFDYIYYEKNKLAKIPIKMIKYNNLNEEMAFFDDYYKQLINVLNDIGFYTQLQKELK